MNILQDWWLKMWDESTGEPVEEEPVDLYTRKWKKGYLLKCPLVKWVSLLIFMWMTTIHSFYCRTIHNRWSKVKRDVRGAALKYVKMGDFLVFYTFMTNFWQEKHLCLIIHNSFDQHTIKNYSREYKKWRKCGLPNSKLHFYDRFLT